MSPRMRMRRLMLTELDTRGETVVPLPNDFEFTGPRSGSGAMRGWAARPGAHPRARPILSVAPSSAERLLEPGCALPRLPRHDLPRAAAYVLAGSR